MKFNKKYPSSPFFQSPLNQVYSQMLEKANVSEIHSAINKTTENDQSLISKLGGYQLPDALATPRPDLERLKSTCDQIALEFYWLRDKHEHLLMLLSLVEHPKMPAVVKHVEMLFKAWSDYALKQKRRIADLQKQLSSRANESAA